MDGIHNALERRKPVHVVIAPFVSCHYRMQIKRLCRGLNVQIIQQPAAEEAFQVFFGFGPPALKEEKKERKGTTEKSVAAVPNLLSRVESSLMTDLLDVIAKVF